MSDKPKKAISRATYLQALGLFTMAVKHNQKHMEFREELLRHLGFNPDDPDFGARGDHIGDATWGDRAFDEALTLEGIEVSEG